MSLLISNVFTYDEDAGNYIQAVETADTQALEPATRKAINNFVIGCKQDGIWTAIKASCILAGARTLDGALVPLAGPAPSNVGPFVSGDYSRKTGLVGNGSKYLDSGYAGSAPPLNNIHGSGYFTFGGGFIVGNGTSSTSTIQLHTGAEPQRVQAGTYFNTGIAASPGFVGLSRSNSATVVSRRNFSSASLLYNSTGTLADNILVFSRGSVGAPNGVSAIRIAFYSIGESLDLVLLDGRVTDLINAFAVTIP
jgi:hypothetical protein